MQTVDVLDRAALVHLVDRAVQQSELHHLGTDRADALRAAAGLAAEVPAAR